jgi:hypothetical protein
MNLGQDNNDTLSNMQESSIVTGARNDYLPFHQASNYSVFPDDTGADTQVVTSRRRHEQYQDEDEGDDEDDADDDEDDDEDEEDDEEDDDEDEHIYYDSEDEMESEFSERSIPPLTTRVKMTPKMLPDDDKTAQMQRFWVAFDDETIEKSMIGMSTSM